MLTKSVAAEVPVVSPSMIVPVPEPPKALALVELITVPALTYSLPVKVLTPDRVRVPAPFWVTPPVPEMIPLKAVFPLPVIVSI